MSPPKHNLNADLVDSLEQRPQIEDDQLPCEKSLKAEENPTCPVSSSTVSTSAPNDGLTPEEEVAE